MVGTAPAAYTASRSTDDPDPLPSITDMRKFVEDYRARPFSRAELDLVDAANLAVLAYGARCQHSDMHLHPELGGTTDTLYHPMLHQRGSSLW